MSNDETELPVVLIGWRPLVRNSLRGFADVRLWRVLSVKEIPVHCTNGRSWCALPAKPFLDASGAAKRTDAGKIIYVPILEWIDRATADHFSAAVVLAVQASHPEAFVSDGDARAVQGTTELGHRA